MTQVLVIAAIGKTEPLLDKNLLENFINEIKIKNLPFITNMKMICFWKTLYVETFLVILFLIFTQKHLIFSFFFTIYLFVRLYLSGWFRNVDIYSRGHNARHNTWNFRKFDLQERYELESKPTRHRRLQQDEYL